MEWSSLNWAVFWFAAGVFGLVEALLIGAALRFRRPRPGTAPAGRATFVQDLAWTLAPALGMAVVFGLAFQAMQGLYG